MKNFKFGAILVIFLLLTIGCSGMIKGQYITVQKSIDEDTFEDFNEVTNRKQVRKVKELLDDADWEVLKEEMEGTPNYQFQFPFKNRAHDKIMSYYLWLSKDGETVELTTDSRDYIHLSEDDSSTLLEILIKET